MSKVTQEHKTSLLLVKAANLFMDNPFFKVAFKTFIKLNDLSELIKEDHRLLEKYKIDGEQFDENDRDLKNINRELLEELALFIKKFDEDEEGVNDIIEILKKFQDLIQKRSKINFIHKQTNEGRTEN